jgi:transaldolase
MNPNLKAAEIAVRLGSQGEARRRPRLESHPVLAAVANAGTTHIYGDSADADEIEATVRDGDGAIFQEVDGATANQPLIRKVIERYLAAGDIEGWARELRAADGSLTDDDLVVLIYGILCGRAGTDVVRRFAAGRRFDVSLQLHMSLGSDAESAKRVGRLLRRMVPSGVVKVPFTPHAPHCFLVARDLEREGIPVNFTSTFSARQALAAAMLADVTLTNIFMGRINQGLDAKLLGEHVDLAAQRALLAARRDAGVKTLLIVASVRDWQTFVYVAGCDVFTSPCKAISELMSQKEFAPEDIRSQLQTSYEDRLGIAPAVSSKVGQAAIARLYYVEPELVQFLRELRSSKEYGSLSDGAQLAKRFDQAGFGDMFYAPSAGEWSELRKNKLPDFDAKLSKRLPLDTLYTLLADADFEKYQEEMDAMIRKALRP